MTLTERQSPIRISLLLNLMVALVFLAAALAAMLVVNRSMRQQTLAEAENKARLILDRNLAVHTYYLQTLKPNLLALTAPIRSEDYFDASWMSSTFAIREMGKYFSPLSPADYYYKDAAINARNPENEADAFERTFLDDLRQNPGLTERAGVQSIDGSPYLVVLRPGEVMQESCSLCHGDPVAAPRDLISTYGAERSFHREGEVGHVISALSVRVPLAVAFAEADRLTLQLSALLVTLLASVFGVQLWLQNRLLVAPLALIRAKAQQISSSSEHLGEVMPLPFGKELSELTGAFNAMSVGLHSGQVHLEERVRERTSDLKIANERLAHELAERVRVEHALAGQRAELQIILDAAPLLIFYKDKENRFIRVNRALAELMGLARDQIEGHTAYEVFPLEAEQYWQDDLRVITSGQTSYHLVEPIRVGAETRWVQTDKIPYRNQHGDIVGTIGFSEDITERRRVEEALRESEHRFRAVAEAASDAIIAADSDGIIVLWNPAAESMFGYRAIDAVGQSLTLIVPEPLRETHLVGLRRAAATGEMRTRGRTVETFGRRRTGDEFPVELSLGTWNIDGRVAFAAICRDISERRAAEAALGAYSARLEELVAERTRELEEALERLVRHERLVVLGQLAGGVGHELRNPLGAIKNATYYLSTMLEDPAPEIQEALHILTKEVGTSDRIISGLLDFAQNRTPRRDPTDINALVRTALSRITVPHEIEVHCQFDDGLPVIEADPAQLLQVLRNLIVNAVQAMENGGKLVLRSEMAGQDHVAVSITDSGPGITSANLEKVFEPLFTTKAKGIGLGLALSKMLVEAHGGTIDVVSRLAQGTEFTVTLPVDGLASTTHTDKE